MECIAQNDEELDFVPLNTLGLNITKKNIYGLLEHVINNTVNRCFYFPDNVFGYLIPSVLHFQRINYTYGTTIDTHSTESVILKRLEDYKQMLISQVDEPMFISKYRRHASSLAITPERFRMVNDIIGALKKYKRNLDEDELLQSTYIAE